MNCKPHKNTAKATGDNAHKSLAGADATTSAKRRPMAEIAAIASVYRALRQSR